MFKKGKQFSGEKKNDGIGKAEACGQNSGIFIQ